MTELFRRESMDYEKYAAYLGAPRCCPVCGANEKEVWAEDPPFVAQRCTKCTFVWIDPALTEDGLGLYYDHYVDFRLQHTKKLEQRTLMYQLDRSFLERHRSSGDVLDIGCSTGLFLETLSPKFLKSGLERDQAAVELARKRNPGLGERIRIGALDTVELPAASFDVVVMRGVIEHILEPSAAVRRVAGLLRPGGVFFVTATPNVDSACAQLYRERWNQFDPIQHVSYFSVPTLARLCSVYGLDLVDYAFPYLETPYASPRADLEQVLTDSDRLGSNGRHAMGRSPAFWGNMLTALFERRHVGAGHGGAIDR